jgi:glutathione peroxidase
MAPYDIPLTTIAGAATTLAPWRDHALLVVNVASKCGYTPQYAGLEALWRAHRDDGLFVLGFPCNQFAGQEPGDETAIATFCRTAYDVTFPLFAKVDVNGPDTHPLYRWLKAQAPGFLGTEAIKWNFTKFLVTPGATRVTRFAPTETAEAITASVVAALPGRAATA